MDADLLTMSAEVDVALRISADQKIAGPHWRRNGSFAPELPATASSQLLLPSFKSFMNIQK